MYKEVTCGKNKGKRQRHIGVESLYTIDTKFVVLKWVVRNLGFLLRSPRYLLRKYLKGIHKSK